MVFILFSFAFFIYTVVNFPKEKSNRTKDTAINYYPWIKKNCSVHPGKGREVARADLIKRGRVSCAFIIKSFVFRGRCSRSHRRSVTAATFLALQLVYNYRRLHTWIASQWGDSKHVASICDFVVPAGPTASRPCFLCLSVDQTPRGSAGPWGPSRSGAAWALQSHAPSAGHL